HKAKVESCAYTVTIEAAGATREAVLDLADVVDETALIEPSLGFHCERGLLTCVATVRASSVDEAASIAAREITEALERAGVDGLRTRLKVEDAPDVGEETAA